MKNLQLGKDALVWHKTHTARYALFGAIFGLLFPMIAVSIDLYRLDLDFTFENVLAIHKDFPIHFIIDTAPFFLGLFASFGGRAMDKVAEKNNQLNQAMEFKDIFLANMSHEIRTPMSGIIGVIDLLSKSQDFNKKDSKYLDIIQSSSNDLMKIINDILDFSKLKAGKLSFDYKEKNIREIVEDVRKLFLAVGESKNIGISTKVDSEVPKYLLLDEVRLKQVLSNLVGNAVKFSSKGNVDIKVSFPDKIKGEILKIEVIDQGMGISNKNMKALFSEYSQLVEEDEACGKQGTGLGLSICKKLVEYMDGELGVLSELGEGSNFWFTIKTQKIESKNTHEQTVSSPSHPEGLSIRVLMAEDNKTLCAVYGHMLDKLGCKTVIVNDGEMLIEKFQENRFDIVLLDVNMPKLDGIKAMQRLKTNYDKLPPMIGISASALQGDSEKYIEQGLDDYLTKPFTIGELAEKLEKWHTSNKSRMTFQTTT
ncbi:ATP-binding protein [Flagellimonas sp.]|uniref:ATP-binding protein n=1 Tax=Flagellimonas sp. TaxID=2058762 RepID=UPI003F4A14A1